MAWTEKRKSKWIQQQKQRPLASAPAPPPVPAATPDRPAQVAPIVLPTYPAFSPGAIAKVLGVHRSTVGYWLANGKLDHYRDCLNEPYVLRSELSRFIREYLQRGYVESDS